MRGISSIIAIVLLLMITISMAGVVYIFMQRSFTPAFNSTSSQVEGMGKAAQTMMKIDSISGNKVYIRNIGSAPISNGSLGIYIGNTLVNYTLPADIPSGQLAELTINNTWGLPTGGSELKITGIGATYSEPVSITPDNSAVLSLSMDEGSGTVIHDSSGYGNNGLMYGINNGTCYNMGGGTGITNCNFVAGKYGSGMDFDGVNDYVNCSNASGLIMGKNFSIEVWIYPVNYPAGWTRIVGKGNQTSRNYGLWRYTNGDILFQFTNITPSGWVQCWNNLGAGDPLNVPSNVWAHIVGTYDGANMKVYRDGILQKTCPTAEYPANGSYPLEISGMPELGAYYFNGSIDEVRIYIRTMSKDEISAIYNGTDNSGLRNGLIGEWKFEDGYGNTTIDTHMWTEGKFGKGLQFDGVDDYVNIRKGISRNEMLSSGMTLSAWINTYSAANQLIIGQDINGGCSYSCLGGLELSSGRLRMVIYNKTSYLYATGTGILNDGNWHHVMGVYGTDRYMRIYVDGKYEAERYTADIYDNLPVNITIGLITERVRFYYPFDGRIDQALAYNKSLTPEQVLGFS